MCFKTGFWLASGLVTTLLITYFERSTTLLLIITLGLLPVNFPGSNYFGVVVTATVGVA